VAPSTGSGQTGTERLPRSADFETAPVVPKATTSGGLGVNGVLASCPRVGIFSDALAGAPLAGGGHKPDPADRPGDPVARDADLAGENASSYRRFGLGLAGSSNQALAAANAAIGH